MIKILSKLEKEILSNSLEYTCWKKLRTYFNKEDFGKKCTCKYYKNGNLKGDVCNHCVSIIDNIFEKIGWFNNNNLVISIKNPIVIFKELLLNFKIWFEYDFLKKPLIVFNMKGEKVNVFFKDVKKGVKFLKHNKMVKK